ncbi:F-box/kelch-repeat protein At3g06240 isoform X3 [Jatropha curcas]|uniref:F-box/kelch-repeat protein At3g06240 isoform X3 n=1 Tax=Jatropha curcas TaxID=180498 RepID=UPI0009D65BB2|nr:F-box/kelch-repeat protein At3g06240 isoform X3 [Jatropha curcas]
MASNKQRNQSLEGEVAVPNLPQEVIQEILLRLPVKSLCRFRCISKSWLSRISSPQFAKAHLDIALRSNILYSQRQRLIFSSGNLYSVEYESICNTNGRDIAVVTLDYPLKEKANGRDDVLDDSRGNDLVYYKVSEDEDENPVIVKVDAKFSSKVTKLDDIWVEIFGSCNGLVCIAPEEDTLFLFNPSTGESKRIPEQSLSRSAPYGYNSYGFGYDPTTDDYKGYFFMELFIGWREIGKVKMTRTLKECLCLLYSQSDMHNDFWMMREYGLGKSWTRVTITYSYICMVPLCLAQNGEALLELDGTLVQHNLETGTYETLEFEGLPIGGGFEAATYVESLISPNTYFGREIQML